MVCWVKAHVSPPSFSVVSFPASSSHQVGKPYGSYSTSLQFTFFLLCIHLPSSFSYLLRSDLTQPHPYSDTQLVDCFSLRLHLRNPSPRPFLPTLYPLNLTLGSSSLHRSKEFQFLKPTPVPVDLEKKRSEAKARNESIIKTLTELKGERALSASMLTSLGILLITLDTAWASQKPG